MKDLSAEDVYLLNCSYYLSSIRFRTGSLLISFKATNTKIDELGESSMWYNEKDSRSSNKHRMKEYGGAIMGFRKYHRELTIIGIAKTIEDLIVDVNEYSHMRFNFWKSPLSLPYFDDMKYVRQINNSIKHSRGIVINDGSDCNKYLIGICGVTEETEVATTLELNIEEYIFKSFFFQYELAHRALNKENSWKDIKDFSKVEKFLIPESLKL